MPKKPKVNPAPSNVGDDINALVTYHSTRVALQNKDQTYYDDVFPVNITKPFHVVRTGSGAKIVDDIVAHIETANPQVFREPKKKSKAAMESAVKVARLLNNWLILLIPEIEEAVKNAVQRGEGIFQIEYNDKYDQQDPTAFPLIVTALDPIYVFTDPYDSLRPDRVAKKFEMNVPYVKSLYPDLKIPATAKDTITYKAYWTKDKKYFEIGGVALTEGVVRNIYGFVPFVHFNAGFGKKSPEGKPETFAVGKLRKIQGRLKEKCEVESRIDSIIGLYANPMRILSKVAIDAADADEEQLKEAYIGPGATLVSPYGWKQDIYVPNVHIEQLLAHLGQIDGALGMESPPILSGQASGPRTSGRLEDILYENVQKRYTKLIYNLRVALAQVLGMGLRILDTIPGALPVSSMATIIKDGKATREIEEITKDDIDGYYECRVELNPEEAIEHDRKIMLGRLLVNEGRISWKKFLVEFMGMTEDEADTTITDAIAETAILTDPIMGQIRTMEAIEQAGMTRYLDRIQQMAQPAPQQTMRPSEAKSPVATATLRQALGEKGQLRTPPEGITR